MNNPSGQPAHQPAQPFAGAVPPNTVLDNRYRLDGRIATGGMGEVWRGVDQTLGRPVAVKLLRPEYASDESFLVRFRGEARHAARLSHPGIASVYDYGEVATVDDHPTAYLVMELVEGEPLSAVLHREKRLSPERMLDVLGQSADALEAAHALNIVHRDIKPGNLLIRPDGVVKVTDFGIARAVDAAPLTATGIMMGTAYYVSPEQASGRPVTPASDVYSLGVVAYECLAGRRPFDDRNPIVVVMAHQQDTPPPLPADVPYQVRSLVEQAMAKNPARRPSSAGAFARSAAGIRRELFASEPRWASGAGVSPDLTARHPAPSGPPPRGRNRAPSWVADGPAGGPGAAYPGARPGYAGAGGTGRGTPSPAGAPQPGATAYQPGATGYQPGATGYQPGAAAGQPGATAYQPGGGYQRGGTGYQQGASGYQPAAAPAGYQQEQPGHSAYQPSPTAYQPTAGGSWPPGEADDQLAETGLAAAHPAADAEDAEPGGWQPGGRAAGGRAANRRAGAAGRRRRRLTLPVLIVLLLLTVAVTALITRSLAGSGGSSHAAASVTQAVTTGPSGGGIVVGEGIAGV
ncbi:MULTISPECIES: serine/threonine-protein kinase [Pseudofrankia]|uniref:serine/threonine-protein kinase n=1 Tax=Pseudofrankia TaxID=2994363 RepID=UPI000480173B|nr:MULTISPECIES: serine/threonine-protein kinase [Pseudofrankia]OHV39928.1 serine/threonine protein kinase [Pseudofrankia sp. EUN1h]